MAKSIRTKKTEPVAIQPEKKAATGNEILISPSIHAAVAIDAWGKFAGEVKLGELVEDVREKVKRVQGGDMRLMEAMLYGQAMTLQTIFTNLARRAVNQEHLKQFQTHLTLALKAQAQCRSTLEALAEIKNPRPVQFVKQANFANGHQQVNNGTALEQATHARETQPYQNELLEEARHGGTHLDTRTTAKAARSHPAVEAVEAVHRAKKPRG